ncbi:MAG: crossover junction endodeoxyribonuclease RuvC [Elusimicrobia bacterium]|nr:crossover junction endodeoxyribonuclease RuvC [Elusimicrobiota bacterium]
MIILGIDPGWDRCGWAKIKRVDNGKNELLAYGLVTTSRLKTKAQRLSDLFRQLEKLIYEKPRPEIIALEEIHLPPQGIRISNLLNLGEARGVLLLAAGEAAIPVQEVHPLQVKSTITGSARSSKQDVARFLKFILDGKQLNGQDDTTDAVAIALTAALTNKGYKGMRV